MCYFSNLPQNSSCAFQHKTSSVLLLILLVSSCGTVCLGVLPGRKPIYRHSHMLSTHGVCNGWSSVVGKCRTRIHCWTVSAITSPRLLVPRPPPHPTSPRPLTPSPSSPTHFLLRTSEPCGTFAYFFPPPHRNFSFGFIFLVLPRSPALASASIFAAASAFALVLLLGLPVMPLVVRDLILPPLDLLCRHLL